MNNHVGSWPRPGNADGTHRGFTSHHPSFKGKIGDFSGCWLPPDLIQFIPQLRGIEGPSSDSCGCLEARDCSVNIDSKLAPAVDHFGRNHQMCTCPKNIINNVSYKHQQEQQQQQQQQHQQIMATRCHYLACEDSNCDSVSSSDCFGCRAPVVTETSSRVCRDVSASAFSLPALSRTTGKLSSSRKSQKVGEESKDFQTKAAPDERDAPRNVRVRGKRLLCPKNATPLYGETPTWWGDDPPSDNRPITSDSEKQSGRTVQSSKLPKADPDQNIEGNTNMDRERRQSTAFVVNLENSEQSTKQSLSSSLPSFQINDHLCSFFPLSRRISLQKREAAVRRKDSLNSEKNQSSDAASENGTYVVDLDFDEEFIGEDHSTMTTPSDINLDSSKEEKLLNSSPKKTNFRKVSESRDLENKNESPKRESKKNTKKVNRKKTFVVSSYDFNGCPVAKCNEPDVAEHKVVGNRAFKKDFETPTHKSSTPSKALDTRYLLKESSWNFDNSTTFLESMDHTLASMRLESPKILSKPKKEMKFGLSNMNIENTEFSPLSSVDTITYNVFDTKEEIEQFNKSQDIVESVEDESNQMTARSMKTELLLKPTEEISMQLRKSGKQSKIQLKQEDNDKESDVPSEYLGETPRNESDENSDESTSCDSIEGPGRGITSSVLPELQEIHRSQIDLESGSKSEIDFNTSVKSKKSANKNVFLSKSKAHGARKDLSSRRSSIISNSSDSTLEGSQSVLTDLSLGQKIVWKSRSTSSNSSEKSRDSFVPPLRKQSESQNQRMTSSYSDTTSVRVPSSRLRKTPNHHSRDFHSSKGMRPIRERSPTELLIRGSSVIATKPRELELKRRSKSSLKLNENSAKLKNEMGDDISCLTAIMKYSAQIQLISGNLLELLSLKRERRHEWPSPEQQVIDKKVTSRLGTMLSTMKASNDLLLDLHDFLASEMDSP